MAKVHVLDTAGSNTRLIFHIAVPVGNNDAGTAWTTVLANSGIGGKTVLLDGNGTGGTISAAEKTSITSGGTYEVEAWASVPTGMTVTQANAFLDALHADKTIEVQASLQAQTRLFGFTRT